MNIFAKAYFRTYQAVMKVAMNFLRFPQPELLEGLDKVPEFIVKKGIGSVLIVTDDVLHNKLKIIDGLKAGLEAAGVKYAVYDKTVPNPTIDNIEEGVALYKENDCGALIAFGGGSPMDCAKGIACRIARPNKTIPQMKGQLKVHKKLPPIFAVPTTSGTGSEATVAAVISNSETHEKYAINDPVLIPKYAVLDPTLTVGLPPHITSTTGMDALTHAVEAYIGRGGTPKTDDMAIKATKLIFENLKRAYDNGSDIKARRNMQYASFYAGIAFTRAYVGNVHAIAHTLGGFYRTPHGLANAVILPHVLDYYGSSDYAKLADLANAVGIKGVSMEAKAKQFIQAIKDMNAYMNIPTTIDGIKEEDIPTMVDRAYAEANPLYPVPKMMDKADLTAMYHEITTKAVPVEEAPEEKPVEAAPAEEVKEAPVPAEEAKEIAAPAEEASPATETPVEAVPTEETPQQDAPTEETAE